MIVSAVAFLATDNWLVTCDQQDDHTSHVEMTKIYKIDLIFYSVWGQTSDWARKKAVFP